MCSRLRTDVAVMYACGISEVQVDGSQEHFVLPEVLAQFRRRLDEPLMEELLAIQAAAAMEAGLVSPAHLVVDTCPTVGIPKTVDPLTPSPTPEEVLRSLNEASLHRTPTPSQVHLACACGYSRPIVERLMASLLCRGAGRLAYKGHRGAIIQTGMAVMAHNAATLVRIHAYRLSKRARKLRRRLRLRCRQVNQFNASIN